MVARVQARDVVADLAGLETRLWRAEAAAESERRQVATRAGQRKKEVEALAAQLRQVRRPAGRSREAGWPRPSESSGQSVRARRDESPCGGFEELSTRVLVRWLRHFTVFMTVLSVDLDNRLIRNGSRATLWRRRWRSVPRTLKP